MQKKFVIIVSLIFSLILFRPAFANLLLDSDHDGVPDQDEINIFHTDPYNPDTDGDGFNDFVELTKGYSPLNKTPVKLEDNDYDHDGLSDRMELRFGTDLANPDTDGDGLKDGDEIKKGLDPLRGGGAKLVKRIEVNQKLQILRYFDNNVVMGEFPISGGVGGTTPKGVYTVSNKSPKAWSPYGLWMPYWIGLAGQRFGLHELPIWPSGKREGADHLGRPVSHGCIRLGIGPAREVYEWVELGTRVIVN